jgi:hypothetical protein
MTTTFTEHTDSPLEIIAAADINLIQDAVNDLEGIVFPTNIVRKTVVRTGIADNTATEVGTITTVNEAGSTDGGAYTCFIKAAAFHNGLNSGDNAVMGGLYHFSRAQQAAGTGQLSAVVEAGETAAAESEGGTTKGIATVTCTVTETSEYITSIKFTVDLDGTTITTAVVVAEIEVIWYGYLTPPVIA